VEGVQIFAQHFCGDARPKINLSWRKQEIHYYEELEQKLDVVKDDIIGMLELSLAFERRRVKILNRKVDELRKKLASDSEVSNDISGDFIDSVDAELGDDAITNFAQSTDLVYKDAIVDHYSSP